MLYLPPYCPDFNPIENAFAKLKALLRKLAEQTGDGLWSVPSAAVSTASHQPNAATTSSLQDTLQYDRRTL